MIFHIIVGTIYDSANEFKAKAAGGGVIAGGAKEKGGSGGAAAHPAILSPEAEFAVLLTSAPLS